MVAWHVGRSPRSVRLNNPSSDTVMNHHAGIHIESMDSTLNISAVVVTQLPIP